MTEPHQHDFSIKLIDVVADNSRYSIAKHGNWSILTRQCDCGREVAFEMLHRKDAAERYKELTKEGI